MESKKNVTLGYLGFKFQQEILNQLLHPASKRFSERIIDIIHAKYFDNEYFRLLVVHIKDYYEKFEKVPNWDTLETIVRLEVKDQITRDYLFEMIKEIQNLDVEDYKFVQEKSLNFCRQQELRKANEKISKIISEGDFESYETCEQILKDALSVGAEKEDGVSVGDNLEIALDDDFRHPIPTGIKGIDELTNGGIGPGELAVVLAPFGVGKSTILTKIANTAYNEGKNVLQIVFEDAPKVIQRKHMSCWTGIELSELSDRKEEVLDIVKEKTNRTNELIIKKFSSEGVTMNVIRTYIRGLLSKGLRIDMLILDYIDCVISERNYTKEYEGEGSIMRSLESMISEMDIACWVATQGSRSSVSAEVVTGDMMGGSIKKAQIGHFIMSIAKTLPQKESGKATIAIIKSRFGKDGVVFEDCTFDNGRVYIDTEETSSTFLGYEKKKENQKEEDTRQRIKQARERKLAEENNTKIN